MLKSENSLSMFITSTLVSLSVVGTVFASVPSFATTKEYILRSDIAATGPLHTSKKVTLGEVIWRKSKVEVLLIQGCEAVIFTIYPKLLAWCFVIGNTNGRFVILFAFLFVECLFLGSPNLLSVFWVTSSKICLLFGNSLPTNKRSICHINQMFMRFSLASKSLQKSLSLLASHCSPLMTYFQQFVKFVRWTQIVIFSLFVWI